MSSLVRVFYPWRQQTQNKHVIIVLKKLKIVFLSVLLLLQDRLLTKQHIEIFLAKSLVIICKMKIIIIMIIIYYKMKENKNLKKSAQETLS